MRTNSTSQVQQKFLRSPFLRFFSIFILSFILCGSTYAQTSVTAGTTTTGYSLNSAATYVDAAIVITSASNITGFKITISSGLKSNDVLAYTGTLPSGVTATAYNSSTGILSFSGSASAANWQTLLRTVTYVNTNTAQYGDRVITFSAGLSSAFSNGHFYELINASTMSWTSAKTAAAARSYLGYGGYLATITSSAENTFIKQVLNADAWIGCSDNYLQINAATGTTTYANQAAASGRWTWVTGPEAGSLFSIGNNSPVTQSGKYAFWNPGEPNDWGGSEDYGEIYSSGTGQWNDLNNSNNLGYVVEYGGLSTDPVQTISSNTTISILIATNTATAPQTICNGATPTALTGSTPTGGNGTYTYRWLSSTTSATSGFSLATGTTTSINYSPGALSVNTWFRREVTSGTLKDTTSAVAITVNTALSTTFSNTNVGCNGGSNGAASVVVSGGTAAYSYNWTPGNPTGDGTSNVTGLTAGTWTCTVTDANSCTTSNSVTITQPSALSVTASSQTNVSCNGGSNGAASINTPTGGTSPYTYNWTPGNPTGDGTKSVTGLTTGTWTCNVTDANNCVSSQTFNITQPSALVASTSQTNLSCNGGSNGTATVVASGGTSGYTYSWSPSGGTSATASGLTAGTFTCTITDANSCTLPKTFTITQPSALTATTSQSNVSCNGGSNGSATVVASGGTASYGYLWSSGGTAATKSSLAVGTFTCTITDANSCTTSKIFTITQPSALSVTAASQTNISCNGGSNGAASINTPTGGTSPYTYNWTPGTPTGDGTTSVTGLPNGTWVCSVQDANLCPVTTSTFTLTQPLALTSTISKINVSCNGASNGTATVVPSGGTSVYTYSWSSSAGSNATVSGLVAGTYTCTITDANSCAITKTTTITQPTAITATTSQTNISCNGLTDGVAGVYNVSGGTAPYSYLWDFGGTNDVESSLSAGTYTCTITDGNGCTLQKNFTITEPSAMSASLTSINSSCASLSNGSATTSVLGGTLPYSYAWSNGATTASISSLDAGTYTVTIQDDNLCPSYVLSVTITNDATITSTVTSTNVSCNGGSDGSVAVTPAGGAAPYTYLWNGGTNNSSLNGLNANTYSVIVTDDNGCSIIETISITEPTAITATTSSTDANCNGSTDGSVSILNVSGGINPYSYEWSNGDLNASVNGLAAGTYTVTVTDDNGCTFVTNATVSEPTLIIANVSTTKTNCFGLSDGEASSAPSGGVAPYTYSWSDGQTTATATGLSAQTYTLIITDDHGCTQTELATVLQPDSITTSYTSIDTRCFNDSNGSATITAIGGTAPYTYNWSTGNIGDTENGLTAGTYSVTVVDDNGCVSFENVTINQPDSLAMNITTQSVTCHGLSDGTAIANPTGGTSPYTFNWGTGSTSSTSLSGLIAQSFSVLITDDNGCLNAESVAISEPDTISATITTTDPLCNGGTGSATATTIGGTGTLFYAWSSGGSNATETNLLADTYLLAITDDNGCSIDKVVTINEPSKISVSSNSVNANCGQSNGSASVVATGGTGNFTYGWSSGGTTDVENNLAAGNYTVTITDANGCSSSETVSVSNIGAPTVVVSQTSVLCNGDNNGTIDLTVSGGTPNYTYTWSNGAITGSLTGLAPITYSYTITDAANCQTVGTVTITEPDVLAITSTTTNDSGSNNGSIDITVTGGVTPYTFDWNDGSTSEDLSNLAAGIYTVIVTDAYGCSRTETITISSSVGINQIEVNNSFIVYPNPNNGQFNIAGNKTMNYELKNNLGQIIQRIQLNASNHYAASINNLSSGVYFINSEDSNSKTIKKIVVIK